MNFNLNESSIACGFFLVLFYPNVYKLFLTLEVKFEETISQKAHGNEIHKLENKFVYCHLRVGI